MPRQIRGSRWRKEQMPRRRGAGKPPSTPYLGTDWSLWGALRAYGCGTRTPATGLGARLFVVISWVMFSVFGGTLWVLLQRWRKAGGRLRAKCQPYAQAKQGSNVLGGGLCPLFWPSGTALLNQLASKVCTWVRLLAKASHGYSFLWKALAPGVWGKQGPFWTRDPLGAIWWCDFSSPSLPLSCSNGTAGTRPLWSPAWSTTDASQPRSVWLTRPSGAWASTAVWSVPMAAPVCPTMLSLLWKVSGAEFPGLPWPHPQRVGGIQVPLLICHSSFQSVERHTTSRPPFPHCRERGEITVKSCNLALLSWGESY